MLVFRCRLLELLEDDELAQGVFPERAAAVLALGQKLAPVRQRMVCLTVGVVDDDIEDLSRLQDATFDLAAKDGFHVSVRDEGRAVRALVPVARHQRQGPFHVLAQWILRVGFQGTVEDRVHPVRVQPAHHYLDVRVQLAGLLHDAGPWT
jgi:hypothetical protein